MRQLAKVHMTVAACALIAAQAAHGEAKIGAIFDLTGGLNIYGIQQDNALKLAVESINAAGGLLGEPITVVGYDAQSEQSKYTQYANTAILKDDVDALFAGLTSSSREAIRPIVRKANVPYFYSSLYEGGACDKQTFVTGPSASQQLSVLITGPSRNTARRSSSWRRTTTSARSRRTGCMNMPSNTMPKSWARTFWH
ncbi:MAG TPA: ABC transporter substrate-binding protein [Albidovulum sp.]|uniref:ABC transporter substrate-binding protein n=1 Tax=Albidovulum sp. TaxID=1872424 RepID=UPI002C0D1B6B|nr:ABC transporter substrate-binding protein [Albidovulum sp.]